MIYGTNSPHFVQDSTDLIGVRTMVLRQYWQCPITRPTQEEVDAFKPAAPPVPGGVMLMGDQTRRERGCFATYWTYQGVNGDGKSVTFKQRGKSIDYGFEPGFAQVPIQVQKDFMKMLDQFQGYPSNDGTTVIWPPQVSSDNGGGGLSFLPKSSDDTNPMFGIQTFFEMEGIYRYRYAERQLPAGLNNGVGYIASNLPGEPDTLEDGRNWLKAKPAWQRKGTIFDITEFYWASRRGGWPEPVYRKGYFSNA